MLPWIISAGFFLTAVGLFIKIRMMQKGTDEIRKIFGECLLEDTNAQITVSSGDRELKEAVTKYFPRPSNAAYSNYRVS